MILPTKHIPTALSIIHLGATLIEHLDKPRTVSALWERARKDTNIGNYSVFVLSLDFLYIIGAIELESGLLRRSVP